MQKHALAAPLLYDLRAYLSELYIGGSMQIYLQVSSLLCCARGWRHVCVRVWVAYTRSQLHPSNESE